MSRRPHHEQRQQSGHREELAEAERGARATRMTLTPSASPARQLAWLSLAMFLGMTLWFSATAANAPIVREFHLTTAETAWLTMAVQGGFVIGTLLSALL